MRSDKKKSNKPAAAIVMCFCLMALVSVFAVKSGIDKVKSSMETADVVKKQSVEDIDRTSNKTTDEKTSNNSVSDNIVDSLDNQKPQEISDDASHKYILPVDGEIIMEHSMDMPIYWETLDQYMVHNGIDISSEVGTPVQSCAGGTVTKIEENDKMGITVEVNHGNELISVYSNLAADSLIELGEVITQGTVIGKVGQSAMFEFESPDHLHFEINKNGEPVDPRDYIN